MFPTFMWKIQLRKDIYTSANTRVLNTLDEMRQNFPPLSASEAWQSTPELHNQEAFRHLVQYFHNTATTILMFLKVGYKELVITGCWANILAKGAAHEAHKHPNNFLSGVYYVQTQPGADTINFHDPRIQTAIIRPPVKELTAENTDQVVVKVSNGTLLVFPSYLEHSVSPNESDKERVSISFNVMFTSFTETMSKPLW
ncbi:MAG: 2OG-Fe(II) oxygenase family protein [Gammaproteobacteria bacterium]